MPTGCYPFFGDSIRDNLSYLHDSEVGFSNPILSGAELIFVHLKDSIILSLAAGVTSLFKILGQSGLL